MFSVINHPFWGTPWYPCFWKHPCIYLFFFLMNQWTEHPKDFFMCGEPVLFCRLLSYFGQPVIGYISTPISVYATWPGWLGEFLEIIQKSQDGFVYPTPQRRYLICFNIPSRDHMGNFGKSSTRLKFGKHGLVGPFRVPRVEIVGSIRWLLGVPTWWSSEMWSSTPRKFNSSPLKSYNYSFPTGKNVF